MLNNTLNRYDFIDRMAKKGYTKKDAACILDDVLQVITEILAEGLSVHFHGFGTFSVHDAAPREGIDFQTKTRIKIPGHRSPKFVPGKLLKKSVKDGVLRE